MFKLVTRVVSTGEWRQRFPEDDWYCFTDHVYEVLVVNSATGRPLPPSGHFKMMTVVPGAPTYMRGRTDIIIHAEGMDIGIISPHKREIMAMFNWNYELLTHHVLNLKQRL